MGLTLGSSQLGPSGGTLNENSSTGFPQVHIVGPADRPDHRVAQLQLNPLMFRKHDPRFRINENMSICNQLRDGSRLAGGGPIALSGTSHRKSGASPEPSAAAS